MLKHALLAFAVCGFVAAAPCMAHAKLQSSSPANNAQLSQAPKTLTLNFSEAAQLAVLKLVHEGQGDSDSLSIRQQGRSNVYADFACACAGQIHRAVVGAGGG